MLSNHPPELKTPQPRTGKSVAVEEPVPLMSAEGSVETASTGNGSANDPGGIDRQPPGAADFEHLV